MIKNVCFLILFIVIVSCKQETSIIGHWHEYSEITSDFDNCYIITDSTISINKLTYGGIFLQDSLGIEETLKYSYLFKETVPEYNVMADTIMFKNGIKWIKQHQSPNTYLKDFSAGYKINVQPFQLKKDTFKTIDFSKKTSIFLAIGKLKSHLENREKGLFKDNYYFQINDKLSTDNTDLIDFILCLHCNLDNINLYINMDRNTPLKMRRKLDSVTKFLNLKPQQVFYLHANLNNRTKGYKNNITHP